MAYYTKEQIEKARAIDLLTYLQECEPTELVYLRGGIYCTRDHDSLKISNGKWYWWSRGFGGVSALDYLMKVKGLSFTESMRILTEGAIAPSLDAANNKSKPTDKRRLLLPERSESNDVALRYLMNRGIDKDLIEACIRNKLIYESLPYHNCVFVGFDNDGIARYACFRATNGERLMGEVGGSMKKYSFRINVKGNVLHIFESPIDLLSYLTLKKMESGRWLAEPMLSLGGVYEPSIDSEKMKLPVALKNMLENHPEVTSIAIHLDNDKTGKTAAWSIEWQLRDNFNILYEPPPRGKDYNDYLRLEKERCRNGR